MPGGQGREEESYDFHLVENGSCSIQSGFVLIPTLRTALVSLLFFEPPLTSKRLSTCLLVEEPMLMLPMYLFELTSFTLILLRCIYLHRGGKAPDHLIMPSLINR